MFCDSNDTTLTSRRHACFENTHTKRSTYFGQTSWFPHMCQVNVPIFILSGKLTPGMFRDSNDTSLTSCRLACFENTHAKRSTYFEQKSWFPHVWRVNVPIFKLSIKWTPGDVLRFQRHNPHLMSTRLLREHSCQTKHLFWAKIMISPWIPDKPANF